MRRVPGLLVVDARFVAAARIERKGLRWVERRWYASPDELSDATDLVLSRRELRRTKGIRIHLRAGVVQLRTLSDIPPVRERELEPLIRGQARRFFRLNGQPMVFGAVWVTGEDHEAVVRAAAVEVALVERLEEAVRRAGLRTIGVSPDEEEIRDRITFVSESARTRSVRRELVRTLLWLAMALTSWSTAGGAYLVDLKLDERRVSVELEALEGPLSQLAEIRSRIDAFAPVAEAVQAQGPGRAWASPFLLGLALSLPESAYVAELDLREPGHGTLTIVAPDPVAVVQGLARAGVGRPSLAGAPEPMSDEAIEYIFTVSVEPRP